MVSILQDTINARLGKIVLHEPRDTLNNEFNVLMCHRVRWSNDTTTGQQLISKPGSMLCVDDGGAVRSGEQSRTHMWSPLTPSTVPVPGYTAMQYASVSPNSLISMATLFLAGKGVLVSLSWTNSTAQNSPRPLMLPTCLWDPKRACSDFPRRSPIARTLATRLPSRMIRCTATTAAQPKT